MTVTREGVAASYVGPERKGQVQGDRCWVFADEGSCLHVRWTSGEHTGSFAVLRAAELALDQAPPEDEYGFETPTLGVTVNCAAVYDRGGELALFEALQAEGHLDDLEDRAKEAVSNVVAWMESDPTWVHVQTELGEDAPSVVRSAVAAALMAVADEG